MPTYEYECKTCGQKFDLFQSIKATPLRRARCESCRGIRPVRRLISSGGAVLFKGSGFYQTDYRSDSYQQAAKADTGASTATTTAPDSAAQSSAGKDSASGSPAPATAKTGTETKKPAKKPAASAAT